MSIVVGVMLLLFCITIVLRHGFGVAPKVEMVTAQIHGLLYMVYLATVVDVAVRLKPTVGRLALMVLSGIIPFMAFFVERRTVALLRDEALGQAAGA
jgi:integral membrane protein